MTTPLPPRRSPRAAILRTVSTLAVAAALATIGCSEKPKPKPPAPPPPPPPPPKAPDPVTVDGLLQAMKADPRVQFPQEKAPTDESFARAVIGLADAVVRGDAGKLRPMLTPPARAVLEQLEGAEEWSASTAKLEAARIVLASGTMAVLALQDPDGAYVLGWMGTKAGDTWVFTNAPTSGEVRRRASEWDSASPMDLIDPSLAGMVGSIPEQPTTPTDSAAPEQPAPAEDPDAPKPDDPIRKPTPAGPINIPRPPGSG